MFGTIHDAFRRRAGCKLAEHEIESLSNGSLKPDDLPARRSTFFEEEARKHNIKHTFVASWLRRWLLQAHVDAEKGIYRGDVFRNEHYQKGWLYAVQKMHDRGLRHSANDRIFEELLADR